MNDNSLLFADFSVEIYKRTKMCVGQKCEGGSECANMSQIMRAAVVSNVPTYFAKSQK
jgi:hypothetical protein